MGKSSINYKFIATLDCRRAVCLNLFQSQTLQTYRLALERKWAPNGRRRPQMDWPLLLAVDYLQIQGYKLSIKPRTGIACGIHMVSPNVVDLPLGQN